MIEPRGIGILYTGAEARENVLIAIMEVLRDFHVIRRAEDCEIKTFDEEGLVNAGIVLDLDRKPTSVSVAIDNALKYIGVRFEKELSKDDLSEFAASLMMHINREVSHTIRILGTETDSLAVVNAIRILGKVNPESRLTRTKLRKYGVPPRALSVIRMVYNLANIK